MLVVCLFLVQPVSLFWSGCLYILLISGYKPCLFSLKGPSCIVFTLIRLWNFWSEISTMLVSVYEINGKIRMWTASSVWTYCGFDPCNYGSDQSTLLDALLVDFLCSCSCNFAVLWKCWLLFYERMTDAWINACTWYFEIGCIHHLLNNTVEFTVQQSTKTVQLISSFLVLIILHNDFMFELKNETR